MSKYLIEVMALAAFSDDNVDADELKFIRTYRELYPPIRDITQAEFSEIGIKVQKRLSAGMKMRHMIEEIGENLSRPEKNKAYALALEVCASNFEMHPLETDFLNLLEEQWGITRKIKTALHTSVELRYQK